MSLEYGQPYEIGIYEIAGGGSGGAAGRGSTSSNAAIASGGGSGRAKSMVRSVTPGHEIAIVIGAEAWSHNQSVVIYIRKRRRIIIF
jgi:hypothetical protein